MSEEDKGIIYRLSTYEDKIGLINLRLKSIEDKLDQILRGPVFNSTLTRIGTLEEICANNLKQLNNMILQVKGIVSQVNTLRGRTSEWDGDEIMPKKQTELLG